MTPVQDTPTDSGAAPDEQQATTRKRGRRGGRRRGKRAVSLRALNKKAEKRQAAWLKAGRPNETQRLTTDLEELYQQLRGERAGRAEVREALAEHFGLSTRIANRSDKPREVMAPPVPARRPWRTRGPKSEIETRRMDDE